MSAKIAPITPQAHGKVKVKPLSDFSVFKERHMTPITVHEFARVASCFPIVFVKSPSEEAYKVVSMFSVLPNENTFVSEDGQWTANYLPQSLARIPFFVSSDEKPLICIDENDPRVSEEEGEALFNEKGEKTEYFDKVIKNLETMIQQDHVTTAFLKKMVELELFQASNLTITQKDGSKQDIAGIHLIEESKLKELSDEKILELHKSGFLALIYMHFASLGQTQNLLRD